MSREAKIFTVPQKGMVSRRVKEYESFGWELLSINNLDVSMSRETQNPKYAELIKFEYQYEDLIDQQRAIRYPITPYRLDTFTAFILFVLFIFPGIFYVTYKNKEMRVYNEQLATAQAIYRRLDAEIKKVCETSRATFFSRNQ
ncbi:MAG: hypothetical protein RBQ70_04080 [Acholeplasma sp.]|jgi:hypothetical protein|nr:hypothetical protein [Acholeplasma sp.]